MKIMTLEQFTEASGNSSCFGLNYPGTTGTSATVRYMACLVAAFCSNNEVDFENSISKLLRGDTTHDERYLMLGRAFSACADRNLGNKYASAVINDVLKWFSEKPITEDIGSLLGLLERFLIASGDAVVEKAEAGDT